MSSPQNAASGYLVVAAAPARVLSERVLVAFVLPHKHPGVAGVAEGSGCARCNAEQALEELVRRSIRHA